MPYQYLDFIMQELMFVLPRVCYSIFSRDYYLVCNEGHMQHAMTITKSLSLKYLFPCNINNNMHNFYYYIYHAKLTKLRIAHVNFVSLTLTGNETTSCPIPVYYFFSWGETKYTYSELEKSVTLSTDSGGIFMHDWLHQQILNRTDVTWTTQ